MSTGVFRRSTLTRGRIGGGAPIAESISGSRGGQAPGTSPETGDLASSFSNTQAWSVMGLAGEQVPTVDGAVAATWATWAA